MSKESTKKEFMGGRFPKRIKDVVQERANQNGQTMNEYLEGLLINVLDNDGDGQVPESQYNELLERLNVLEANQKQEAEAVPFIDPSTGIVADLSPMEEAEDTPEEPVMEETIIEETVMEVTPIEAEIEAIERSPLEVLRESLPPVVAGELSAEIAATWAAMNGTTQEPKSKILIADFFETLAEKLTDKAKAPHKFPRKAEALLSTLPASYQAEIIPIIEAARAEFKGDVPKERFFIMLADLLNDAADRLYIEARAFEIVFTRAEFSLIDQMLEKTNKYREKPLVDLQAWIYEKLGVELRRIGEGWLVDNTPMRELGKTLIERGKNRLTAKK